MKTFSYPYPRPSVTCDCIIIRETGRSRSVLLIRRKHDPYKGNWALPGGFVDIDEDLEDAASRELEEETGIKNLDLVQFRAYGKPGRDPRGRTISVVFWGYYKAGDVLRAGDDAADTKWFDLKELPSLAFDHEMILVEFIDSQIDNNNPG